MSYFVCLFFLFFLQYGTIAKVKVAAKSREIVGNSYAMATNSISVYPTHLVWPFIDLFFPRQSVYSFFMFPFVLTNDPRSSTAIKGRPKWSRKADISLNLLWLHCLLVFELFHMLRSAYFVCLCASRMEADGNLCVEKGGRI